MSRRQAGARLLGLVAVLSAAACQSPPPTKAEQDRMARAMAKVEAEQAESDRTLRARDAANARQVVIANQQAK